MLLKNKIVIVSGIGPGLGVKLAVEAARAGARAVVVGSRSTANLDNAEAQICALGIDCDVLKVVVDITDRAQCKNIAQKTIDRFGCIDALVNSAYLHGAFEPIETAHLEDWRATFDTNVIGSMNLTLEVVGHMKTHGGGAIVMINTLATRKPFPGEAGYAASKGALSVAAKFLARELGCHGIRVNSVYMGWMWGTPVQDYVQHAAVARKLPQEQIIAEIAANIPLGHIPTDDDCAKAALFMVSDYANAVTGTSLDVNGGEYMSA